MTRNMAPYLANRGTSRYLIVQAAGGRAPTWGGA
jgi:hypothetical protein